ncbi:MAG: hypothetical protein ACUVRV_00665 [Cyanobacteriota bacterium]
MSPHNCEFAQAAAQPWGGQVNWRTALAYDATCAFLQAFGLGSLNRSAVLTSLGNPSFLLSDKA